MRASPDPDPEPDPNPNQNAAAEAAAERLLAEEDARAARRGLKEKLSSRRRDAKG